MSARLRSLHGLVGALWCAACTGPVLTPTPDTPSHQLVPAMHVESELRVPQISDTKLENGLRVLSVDSPDAHVISITFADRAAVDSDVSTQGLAGLTALAITSGTLAADGSVLRRSTVLGDAVGWQVGQSGTAFRVSVLPTEAAQAFEELARLVQKPALDAEALRAAESAAAAKNEQSLWSFAELLPRLGAAELYDPWSSWGHLTLGSKAERARITVDALRGFYARRYRPENSALLIVGPLSAAEGLAQARAHFEAWRPSGHDTFADVAPDLTAPTNRVPGIGLADWGSGAVVAAVLPCPRRNSPDTVAADLSAILLGDLWATGLLARLRQEEGTSYFTNAECLQSRTSGLFSIMFDTQARELQNTLYAVTEELERLRNTPVSEADLATARALYINRHAVRTSTTSGLSSVLLDQFWSDLPPDYQARFESLVNSTTAEDIRRFAQRYLDPKDRVIVVAGDPRFAQHALANVGRYKWKDKADLE
jgi:zinc protease